MNDIIVAFNVVFEPQSALHIGVGKVGNALEQIELFIPSDYEIGGDGHVNYLNFKRVSLIPHTTVKGVLRSMAEKIAKNLYRSDDLISKIVQLHHQPDPIEMDTRKERGLLPINVVHAGPEDLDFSYTVQRVGSELGTQLALDPTIKAMRIAIPRNDMLKKAFFTFIRSLAMLPLRRREEIFALLEAGADKLYEIWASTLCPLCILFGSPLRGGGIKITPLIPKQSIVKGFRTHVVIERERKIRAEGKLYTIEVSEPSTQFAGFGYIVIPPIPKHLKQAFEYYDEAVDKALHIFRKISEYLNKVPISIGLAKSRGYGCGYLRIEMLPAKDSLKL